MMMRWAAGCLVIHPVVATHERALEVNLYDHLDLRTATGSHADLWSSASISLSHRENTPKSAKRSKEATTWRPV